MRKLASVQRVLEVASIPNADKIEEIKVMGWHCVAKKGEFKVGDSVVYCEIDTILPADNPDFAFLKGKPIKTKKLRGIYSQGIAFPLSVLPDGTYKLNDDVSQVLGAKKWEPDDYNRQGGAGARFPSKNFMYAVVTSKSLTMQISCTRLPKKEDLKKNYYIFPLAQSYRAKSSVQVFRETNTSCQRKTFLFTTFAKKTNSRKMNYPLAIN